MAPAEKRQVRGRASLGPTFPIVGVKDFTKLKVNPGRLREMWDIIGPTVELNMVKRVELWQIFVMCYIQGLENGASLEREKHENSSRSGEHEQGRDVAQAADRPHQGRGSQS